MFLQPSSVLLLYLLSIASASPSIISVSNGGVWGNWGQIECCAQGYVAKGFSLKIEEAQGYHDDTAVNGIRLYCLPRDNTHPEHVITSSQGPWGFWTFPIRCLSGYLVSFSLRVEPPQGHGDDTAVNNIKFTCSDGQQLVGVGLPWGKFGAWSETCPNGVCGILTRVEGKQGDGDDTALNDAQLFCCSHVY